MRLFEEKQRMKTLNLLLALSLGSFGAYAQSSSNTIEGSVEQTATTTEENPLEITNTLSFQSNIDEVQTSADSAAINQDKFYNTLGVSKTLNMSDFGSFKTTYTPSVSAMFTNADTEAGKDSDTLKSADIQNAISMSAQSGNIEYGIDLGANFHYGYTYKMRTPAPGAALNAYRRNDNRSNFSVSSNAAIAVSSEYKLGATVGMAYQDAMGARVPQAADYAANKSAAFAGHIGDTYDMTTITAGISNDVILSENFTLSMPINFMKQDYHNFNAFDADWAAAGDKRMRDFQTIGLTLGAEFEMISFSTGLTVGIVDDKSIVQIEDADIETINTSLTVKVSETIAVTATHMYDAWLYDTKPEENDERYNNYGLGIAVSNVADSGIDAELSHLQINGQSNFDTGKYKTKQLA